MVQRVGKIQVTDSTGLYTAVNSGGDDFAGYVWQLNTAPKSTSWDARVDAILPNVAGIGELARIELAVMWPSPLPGFNPVNRIIVGMVNVTLTRGFFGIKETNGSNIDTKTSVNFSQSGSVRLVWNTTVDLFSLYFDDDGGQDTWDLLETFDINDWGMQESDEFVVSVTGYSENLTLSVADGVKFDNFNAFTTPVPEPSVMLLFAFGALAFWRKRIKQ